jgi:hypothetical protein
MHTHQSLLGLLATAIFTGCGSFHVQEYVAPEVDGRVLDACTGQPIQHVVIRRGSSDSNTAFPGSEKGGEQMLARVQTMSNRDGFFHLDAEKDVLTFGGGGYGASLTFLRSDYETLRTNFPPKLVVRFSPKDPPKLDAGEIFLHPLRK